MFLHMSAINSLDLSESLMTHSEVQSFTTAQDPNVNETAFWNLFQTQLQWAGIHPSSSA